VIGLEHTGKMSETLTGGKKGIGLNSHRLPKRAR
jgi:hypothetical protein